jgi:hypothetical protein
VDHGGFLSRILLFPCAVAAVYLQIAGAEFISLLKEGLWGLLTCVHKRLLPIRKCVPIVCLTPDTSGGWVRRQLDERAAKVKIETRVYFV